MGFSLKDQKGLSSLIQFPKDKITVLAFADREGSAQMEKWIQPLYAKYTDQIDIHGIADLSAVPRFARGIAQSIVSGLVKYPVMLDWEGNISQAYKVEKAKTNLYVIDPQGDIHLHLSGPASAESLSEINLKIAELLD
ncbi:MAG: TlpA family protein disulfide reductase [Candidatus Sericytochromatia bacterium]